MVYFIMEWMRLRMKEFNLKVKRPKVLLLGNGLNYYNTSQISWDDLIGFTTDEDVGFDKKEVPNVVKALVSYPLDDKERNKDCKKKFSAYKYLTNPYYDRLTELPFDAILTTNYTYELENSLEDGFSDFTDSKKRRYGLCFNGEKRLESKYCLQTCYRFGSNSGSEVDVWHIHGEIRKPSTLILTHDEYVRLIHRIVDYNKKRDNDYERFSDSVRMKSWIDYFILGDIYILGFGFDFSEFDLWWLLSRRLRENSGHGKVVFFNPESPVGKPTAIEYILKKLDVSVESFGIRLTDDKEQNSRKYFELYDKAIEHIIADLEKEGYSE